MRGLTPNSSMTAVQWLGLSVKRSWSFSLCHVNYHGSYVILEQLAPVDSVVSTPDCRKSKLLKKYHERHPTLDPKFRRIPEVEPEVVSLVDPVEVDPQIHQVN